MEDLFSASQLRNAGPSMHFFTFVCSAVTEMVVHIKLPCSPYKERMPSGQWYGQHTDAHNTSRKTGVV